MHGESKWDPGNQQAHCSMRQVLPTAPDSIYLQKEPKRLKNKSME